MATEINHARALTGLWSTYYDACRTFKKIQRDLSDLTQEVGQTLPEAYANLEMAMWQAQKAGDKSQDFDALLRDLADLREHVEGLQLEMDEEGLWFEPTDFDEDENEDE